MKRQIILYLFFFLANVYTKAQINDVYSFLNLHTLQKKNNTVMGFNADAYLASNAVKNNLSNAFLYNKFIDDKLKSSVSLKNENYYGQKIQSNFYYSHKYDTLWGISNMGIKVGVNYQMFKNMSFSKDFYNLVMYGNKQYEGKTADLSNLDINMLSYQSIELGFFKYFKEPANGYHTLYFGFNLIKGQEYQYLYFQDAKLFTAPAGEYIDLDIKSGYFGSDSVASNILDFNGIGASLNFYWAYEDEKHKSRYEVAFTELGLISWYKNPLNYMADTNIRLEGVEVNNIFSSDEEIAINSKDSILKEIYSTENNKTFLKSLPKQFNFTFSKYLLDNKYIARLGAGYIFNANQMMPVVYSDNKFFLDPRFNIGISVAYGGYTGFRIGLSTEFTIKNKFHILLSSSNIAGFVLDENTYSQAMFVGLTYCL